MALGAKVYEEANKKASEEATKEDKKSKKNKNSDDAEVVDAEFEGK